MDNKLTVVRTSKNQCPVCHHRRWRFYYYDIRTYRPCVDDIIPIDFGPAIVDSPNGNDGLDECVNCGVALTY